MRIKRIISICCALFMLCSVSAFAVSNDDYNLGYPDPEGHIIEYGIPFNSSLSVSSTLPFSFTGSNVENLVVTSSPKYFTKAKLTSGYLKISGSASYSYSYSGLEYRVGGCYLKNDGTYGSLSGQHVQTTNGSSVNSTLSRSAFAPDTIYYGFLKNLSDSNGYNKLTGTFTLSNSAS